MQAPKRRGCAPWRTATSVVMTIDGRRRTITKRETIATRMVDKSASADPRATKMLIDTMKGVEQRAGEPGGSGEAAAAKLRPPSLSGSRPSRGGQLGTPTESPIICFIEKSRLCRVGRGRHSLLGWRSFQNRLPTRRIDSPGSATPARNLMSFRFSGTTACDSSRLADSHDAGFCACDRRTRRLLASRKAR